jgi:hypothetical protein
MFVRTQANDPRGTHDATSDRAAQKERKTS